jgi:hypothetical protein
LLPARVMVYYVLALCLFFGDAYEEVMRKLVGGLQFLRCWHGDWAIPTPSALCQARQRLGEAPLQALFERVAVPMTGPGGLGWYRSWRVMAIDGVVLDAPDSPENVAAFGKWRNAIAASPFPQVRVVGLAECGSRAIVAARIEPCHTDEKTIARDLTGDLDEGMLLLADRGFYGYEMWKLFRRSGAELLWRVQLRITLPVHQTLPDGSYLSSLAPRGMRSQIARGKSRRIDRYEIPVRVVDYTISNGASGEPETIRLVTSILDHELAPAVELAALYHQRWEIELAFDEIETHQIGHRVLRSRSPQLVRQEIWALLLTHYAVRHLMFEAADDIDTEPDRISFLRTLRIVRRQVTDQAAFSPRHTRRNDQEGNR